jgi:hypothetical protein
VYCIISIRRIATAHVTGGLILQSAHSGLHWR